MLIELIKNRYIYRFLIGLVVIEWSLILLEDPGGIVEKAIWGVFLLGIAILLGSLVLMPRPDRRFKTGMRDVTVDGRVYNPFSPNVNKSIHYKNGFKLGGAVIGLAGLMLVLYLASMAIPAKHSEYFHVGFCGKTNCLKSGEQVASRATLQESSHAESSGQQGQDSSDSEAPAVASYDGGKSDEAASATAAELPAGPTATPIPKIGKLAFRASRGRDGSVEFMGWDFDTNSVLEAWFGVNGFTIKGGWSPTGDYLNATQSGETSYMKVGGIEEHRRNIRVNTNAEYAGAGYWLSDSQIIFDYRVTSVYDDLGNHMRDIYLLDLETGMTAKLFDEPASRWHPHASATTGSICFTNEVGILLVTEDGTEKVILEHSKDDIWVECSFSKDGTRLAVTRVSPPGTSSELKWTNADSLYVYDLVSGTISPVSTEGEIFIGKPSWSASDQYIAIEHVRSFGDQDTHQIQLFHSDGGVWNEGMEILNEILLNNFEEGPSFSIGGEFSQPSWGPP